MRTKRPRKLWSIPMSIAALVFAVAIWALGVVLLATGISRGPDGGSLLGLAFVLLAPLGVTAAIVELVRSAVNAEK